MTNSLQNSQVQVAVEMWRYNPRKLSTRNTVDELSLALREDADERVEEAVEEMLNAVFKGRCKEILYVRVIFCSKKLAVGSHVCHQLLERGDEVRTFALKGDKSAKYIPEEAEIAYGDIT